MDKLETTKNLIVDTRRFIEEKSLRDRIDLLEDLRELCENDGRWKFIFQSKLEELNHELKKSKTSGEAA